MAPPILSRRDLNRATLARQMLLDRRQMAPLKAIEMLAGLQAQVPRAPFISLWSRLSGFKREDLSRLIHARKAIRATMMRGTIHLMGRKDFIAFRNLIQPVLTQVAHTGGQMKGIDIDTRLEEGRRILEKAPQTFDAFRKALRETSPGVDDAAVARAVQFFLPLIRVPDDSPWSFKANAAFFPAHSWLKQSLGPDATVGELMLRYLAAFGPATVADAQMWSGLRTLRPVFEELRPTLAVFRDERGRELFDLRRAPRPSADTPAPVRFLPDYDNLLLAHADRSRVIADHHRERMKSPNGIGVPTLLVDGVVAGAWKIERTGQTAMLVLKAFDKLGQSARDELEEECRALVAFVEGDDVKFKLRYTR